MRPRKFKFNITKMARFGLILMVLVLLWAVFSPYKGSESSGHPEITYSQLLTYMQEDLVRDATYNPSSGLLSLSLGVPDSEAADVLTPEEGAQEAVSEDPPSGDALVVDEPVLPDIDQAVELPQSQEGEQ